MNIAESLAREIRRVSATRTHYAELARLDRRLRIGASVNVEPAIALMDAALEAACLAAGSGEALDTIHALGTLKGFRE